MENGNGMRAGAVAAVIAWGSGIAMAVLTRGVDPQVTDMVEPQEKLLAVVHGQPHLLLQFMGFDTLFIIGYLAVFCALFLCVPRDGRLIAGVGLAFGLLAGLTDVVENTLYIVYGMGFLHGVAIAPALPFHDYVSALKWGAAFTSVGLIALVFPRRTRFERVVVGLMAFFPLAGAVSIAEPRLVPLRAVFFLVGMPLFAVLFIGRARGTVKGERTAAEV